MRRSKTSPASPRAHLRASLRFAVLQRDGFRCRYCGQTNKESSLVVDHVVPISRGGTNEFENLAAACHSCNAGKSDAPLISEKSVSAFSGLWIHTFSDCGCVKFQGKILRESNDKVAVQLYSWVDGEPTNVEIFSSHDMGKWKMYASNFAMKQAYEQNLKFRLNSCPVHRNILKIKSLCLWKAKTVSKDALYDLDLISKHARESITAEHLAELIHCCENTLALFRAASCGPRFFNAEDGSVRYWTDSVRRWLSSEGAAR